MYVCTHPHNYVSYLCIQKNIHTYIHPSIHTSIHTYIHPSIHPYIHTYIHPYIHTYLHISIHTYIHTYIHRITMFRSMQKHIHTHTYIHAHQHNLSLTRTHSRPHAAWFTLHAYMIFWICTCILDTVNVCLNFVLGDVNK